MQSLKHYLSETLGLRVQVKDWPDANSLPHALRADYAFNELRLQGKSYLLMRERSGKWTAPNSIAKQMKWIGERTGLVGVFEADTIESFNRRRLIELKIPFVVPGNQLYLPDLGIDLREHMKRLRERTPGLSPSAQLVLLAFLLKKIDAHGCTATSLATDLDSNKMTMSRAIDDLESLGLIEIITDGRERKVQFADSRRSLWKQALPSLKTPVSKRVYLEQLDRPIGMPAGMSALATQTILMEPDRQVWALNREQWKNFQSKTAMRIIPKASKDLAPIELEIWRYDPQVLTEGNLVDPLSLFLSLQNDKDERVQGALEGLLEGMQW